jgi:hypothetical protein
MANQNNIELAADFAQFYSLYLLLKDASNSEIMQELQHQNKAYLEEILARLDKLEKRLDFYKKNSIIV